MALGELQGLLARLYTDTAFRDRFLADPYVIGSAMGLCEETIQRAVHLPCSQIHYFAATLKSKRLGEVAKLLPLTHNIMDEEFRRHFSAFADGFVPTGIKRHRDDALHFADYLLAQGTTEVPWWIPEVIRYERLLLETANRETRWVLCSFRVAILPLVRDLIKRDPSAIPDQFLTLLIGYRVRNREPLRWINVRIPRILHAAISICCRGLKTRGGTKCVSCLREMPFHAPIPGSGT